tara:strand:- start:104 stop:466 length:363 start_codon:yes stop_codon:yes gene_type:complete
VPSTSVGIGPESANAAVKDYLNAFGFSSYLFSPAGGGGPVLGFFSFFGFGSSSSSASRAACFFAFEAATLSAFAFLAASLYAFFSSAEMFPALAFIASTSFSTLTGCLSFVYSSDIFIVF